MKVIFTGSGPTFSVGSVDFQASILVESSTGSRRLLLGCGSDCRFALYDLDLSYKDIQDVYIATLYSDHVGGLEWLSFTTKFDPFCKEKVRLHIAPALVEPLWKSVLAGGLSSMQGIVADLSTYFNVCPITKNYFEWEGVKIHIYPAHDDSPNAKSPFYHRLSFQSNSHSVFIAYDAMQPPSKKLFELYQKSDIIFQSCEGKLPWPTKPHENYMALKSLDPSIRNKMWLFGIDPTLFPNAEQDGFRGVVSKGQIFNL